MAKRQKLLIIVGPTSSGKSALAVSLARRFGGEVVSADSRQIYKGLDIGTGKVTKRETQRVPHHLLDVASPKKIFTAHDFTTHARRAIDEIARRERLPIVAGGTGFYIDALVGNTALPDVPPNKKLRAQLAKKTPAQLFALLKKRDPRRAKTIDRHNPRRLIRALEIAHALGKNPVPKRNLTYDVLWIGIAPPMDELRKKIATRLRARLKRGMLAEAKKLHAEGLSYKRMEAFGLEYRSQARYLQGKISREEMVAELERDIYHYAKRQMTYWRRNKKIRWFDAGKTRTIETDVRSWIQQDF